MRLRTYMLTCVLCFLLADISHSQLRTWSDGTGQYSVEAEFVEVLVTIRKGDGKTITIPLERLSKIDQEFVGLQLKTNGTDGGTSPSYIQPSALVESADLITFQPGKTLQKLTVTDGTDYLGLPIKKAVRAEAGSVFYVVECTINVKNWPQEQIEPIGKVGVNVDSGDICLETVDGRIFHPEFASYYLDSPSEEPLFAPGPLRNVGLQSSTMTSADGSSRPVMLICVVRPGPKEDTLATTSGGKFGPNLTAFEITFAFSIPETAEVKKCSVKPN